MAHLDRLTSLLAHMQLQIEAVPLAQANLAAFQDGETDARTLMFHPCSHGLKTADQHLVFALHVNFTHADNPLAMALPDRLEIPVQPGDDLENLTSLLGSEYSAQRCGAPAVLSRLGEVLVVRLLRVQIDRGITTPGLLGGLAHPRISAALVAVHKDPGQPWQNTDLAGIAGLSNSRFKELFVQTVGQTPASYVRQWRLTRARQDLEQGARVERIAYRYGYTAADAFSRAFRKQFGCLPRDISPRASRSEGPAPHTPRSFSS